MMNTLLFPGRAVLSCLMVAVLLAAGCSSSAGDTPELPPNKVTGKLTLNGAPIDEFEFPNFVVAFAKMDGDERPTDITEALGISTGDEGLEDGPPGDLPPEGDAPAPAGPEVYQATVNEDGTYEVNVPNGKFVIVVHHFPEGPLGIDGPIERADSLKGRFGVRRSPLVRDISGDTQIDLKVGTK